MMMAVLCVTVRDGIQDAGRTYGDEATTVQRLAATTMRLSFTTESLLLLLRSVHQVCGRRNWCSDWSLIQCKVWEKGSWPIACTIAHVFGHDIAYSDPARLRVAKQKQTNRRERGLYPSSSHWSVKGTKHFPGLGGKFAAMDLDLLLRERSRLVIRKRRCSELPCGYATRQRQHEPSFLFACPSVNTQVLYVLLVTILLPLQCDIPFHIATPGNPAS